MFGSANKVPQSNDTQPPVVCPPQNMDPQCAWCLSEQGQDMGNGSHGICIPHAEQQYEKYRASKVVRQ